MTDAQSLDAAHAAMTAHPEDEAARLRYYARFADDMLYLVLEEEAVGSNIRPVVLELEEGSVVLAYDSEERMGEATDAPVPYAELPGRVIAAQLAGQNVALGINLGLGEAEFLVAPEALSWLSQTLEHTPVDVSARPVSFEAPRGLPAGLMLAIEGKLARAGGLAQAALLAAVRYDDGRQGHMLAFVGAAPGAQTALTRAASEALTFSGVEAGEMDVTFLDIGHDAGRAAAERMARVAHRFDLPEPVVTEPPKPAAPGMDPTKPPKLR
ncbi:SseB family protein (plasmid) [Pseudorhodobacter turbinis]|uniref:SseB family protein n=1 Tax=Pseudorhodobacter turbinis TaxID=2500533 RepID=A0A4V1E135_9RHOB|nr:SseB family protein [Pseudorhodobacter turbinis]QCO56754.1 SseB family protein [Pseudorhodobacter turbinis]